MRCCEAARTRPARAWAREYSPWPQPVLISHYIEAYGHACVSLLNDCGHVKMGAGLLSCLTCVSIVGALRPEKPSSRAISALTPICSNFSYCRARSLVLFLLDFRYAKYEACLWRSDIPPNIRPPRAQ